VKFTQTTTIDFTPQALAALDSLMEDFIVNKEMYLNNDPDFSPTGLFLAVVADSISTANDKIDVKLGIGRFSVAAAIRHCVGEGGN
jgi:hypothetical protein